MNVSIEQIRSVIATKGYIFFDGGQSFNLNIIGVRSNSNVPNSFDDQLHLIYRGEDGVLVNQIFPITTDPGLYWLENPMNIRGTAILVPGQYRGSHAIGLHRNRYEALTQVRPIKVWRDSNQDHILDFDGIEDNGLFGINIHRSNPHTESSQVDKWSAGCQVFKRVDDFNQFMSVCKQSRSIFGNSFTYTLLTESDF